jgi:hypothetical protein
MDDLAWDLGDPDGDVVANGNPFNPLVPPIGDPLPHVFHPMKGPMTTQSLRGLANLGPQHWRGDRQGGEVAAFEAFNQAFPGLLGRAAQLTPAQMAAFRKFALLLRYPPNPIRRIDNALRPTEDAGAALYSGRVTDTVANCDGCHVLDGAAGHFGGDGRTVFDASPQHIKIPHLRNQYQKIGMFGMSQPLNNLTQFTGSFAHTGPQVRGTGFLHDGSIDSLGRFLGLSGFSLNAAEEAQLHAFLMAFESDLAPAVGQQVTLDSANAAQANPRIDVLLARSGAAFVSQILGGAAVECELVAKVVQGGAVRGYLHDPGTGLFLPDGGGSGVSDGALRALAGSPGQEVTYTCVPPGAGQRMGRDRDLDTLLDGVETNTGVFAGPQDTGSDPAAADSDGDGFGDAEEVFHVPPSDPNDPLSTPGQAVPALSAPGLVALAAALALVAIAGCRRRTRWPG